ncbi:sensor histidine kinase [Chloroflexota bacterium]
MDDILIQTDIFSLLGTVLGALIAGAIGMWFYLRQKRRQDNPVETSGDQTSYMLLSRLAHRLKTAGEVIRGHLHPFSEQMPTDSDRWRVAYRAILEEASGIDYLTNHMDLVVRLGLTGQPLVLEPINIPRLLEDLMLNLAPAAEAKGIVVGGIVNCQPEAVAHISADVSALREVFSNLLENAVKHNGDGTEVVAEVKQLDRHLMVCIRDTGKGIPAEVISTIFEKGSSGYHPRITRGSGMGLIKRCAEFHA